MPEHPVDVISQVTADHRAVEALLSDLATGRGDGTEVLQTIVRELSLHAGTEELVVYPVVIALMIGFALSSPPGKPKVAFFSEVAPGKGKIQLGSQQINVSSYASQLFQSIQPIRVHSREEAAAKVKSGQAQAAVIVPGDIVSQIQNLVTTGVGSPTVELILTPRTRSSASSPTRRSRVG